MHIEELQVENLRLEIWMWREMEIPYEKKRLDFTADSPYGGISYELRQKRGTRWRNWRAGANTMGRNNGSGCSFSFFLF